MKNTNLEGLFYRNESIQFNSLLLVFFQSDEFVLFFAKKQLKNRNYFGTKINSFMRLHKESQ